MTTRFYFHDALSGVSGTLPSTEQNTALATPQYFSDAETVNRSMNTTIGTAQASKAIVFNEPSTARAYFTRFVSEPLSTTSISANTWTLNFAGLEQDISFEFPNNGGSTITLTVYVWRPSTGSKVGDIINTAAGGSGFTEVTTNERSVHGTFSGSAVTCQAGDVICIEMYFNMTDIGGTSANDQCIIYYDGTTVNTVADQAVSNHASFLETPQDNLFTSPSIDATSDYKDILKQRPQQLITNSI